MTGEIRALKLHVMETEKCDLSCAGCYLKEPREDGLDWIQIRSEYLAKVDKLDEIGSAFYLNSLDRNVGEAMERYHRFLGLFQQIFHPDLLHKALVTDSITATRMNSEEPALAGFSEFWASCRNLSSVKHLVNADRKWGFLFTVGTDSLTILDFLFDIPGVKIDLNIRKEYSAMDLTQYYQILQIGLRLKPQDVRGDNCMNYKLNKRDCSKPDGFLEMTTFLDGKKRFHLCAYPSNKCRCTMRSKNG
jgi:hypothetical protein